MHGTTNPKFLSFWYHCYYFTLSETYFIQLETLLTNHLFYTVGNLFHTTGDITYQLPILHCRKLFSYNWRHYLSITYFTLSETYFIQLETLLINHIFYTVGNLFHSIGDITYQSPILHCRKLISFNWRHYLSITPRIFSKMFWRKEDFRRRTCLFNLLTHYKNSYAILDLNWC